MTITTPNRSDTDNSDSGSEIMVRPAQTKRPLKEVAIPTMARMGSKKSSHLPASTSPTDSTLTSITNTSRDVSTEYETPGTTPATSIRGTSAIKRKHSSLGRSVVKISNSNSDEEDDEKLARQLQEEEYAKGDDSSSKKRAKHVVDDSETESELTSMDSDTIPLLNIRRSSTLQKKQPTNSHSKLKTDGPTPSSSHGGKLTLPTRAASTKARSSIGQSKKIKIEDSESDSLSEPPSDEEFVDEKSEAMSTAISDSDSDVPLASLDDCAMQSQPKAVPNRRRRNRRQRNQTNRRFGNIRADQAEEISEAIEDAVENALLGRKERERKKLEKSHPSIITMWNDLEKIPIIEPVAAPQPDSITRKLKQFQLEGLDWMIRQEKSHYKGGLLGDEMGMGKTIQAVSLIMSDYPQKQPSLVVVPPVALMQWSTEIKDYTDGKLNVLVYHGQNSKVKSMSVKQLKTYDVIMISYNSLESLHRKETKGWTRGEDIIKEDSPIHAIHFHRLILDEAHSIKQRTTGVARACFALEGTYKWCLSGTPVQNRIGEFFSLLRFLEVRPFADYFCKRCPCSMLHWKLDADHRCANCKHSGIEHVSVFNQELLNPLTQSDDPSDRSKAMDKLHMITARIMLRRMKRDHTSSMELPPKEVIVHNEFFGEIERDFSSSIMSNTSRQFDTYVARGVVLNNYANIFGLIMQMRQVANHPDLILKKHATEGQNVLVCNICDEVAEEAIRSQCKHDFCRACVKSFVQSVEETGGEADCPRCHIPLSIDFDQPEIEQDEEVVKKSSIINRIKMEDWTSSTKIEMLIYDLYKLRSKKQTLKSIVFSQFTSMLQLIEWRLRRAGFNTVMLDGSMTPIQRQRSIEYFMTNPDVEIFLVSLKAGGVALNLTEASRVFIVDP